VAILQKAFEKYGDRLIEETGFACMAELLIKLRSLDVLAVEVPLVLRYDQKSGTSKMNVLQTVKRTLSMISRLRTRQ
jgi:dolichol-phosphate mannosyltransferase